MPMSAPAERMKSMRARRHARGLREVRLLVPDTRLATVRRRIAQQVAKLSPESEKDALDWIESVSIFDEKDEAR